MIPEYTITRVGPAPLPASTPTAAGRWYYAVPKHGATQPFRTPFAAFMALDRAHAEGDVWTAEGSGPRVKLGHRTLKGEWT